MKDLKKVFLSSVTLLLLNNTQAVAHDGTINITGDITDNTCIVSPDSKNFAVEMGNVASKQFHQTGDATRYEPFSIYLEKCGAAASGVTVTFTGPTNSLNPDLLALNGGAGAATGMGLGIYNPDKTLLSIGKESEQTTLTPDEASVTLSFYARYVADGASVTSGNANTSATFLLTYA